VDLESASRDRRELSKFPYREVECDLKATTRGNLARGFSLKLRIRLTSSRDELINEPDSVATGEVFCRDTSHHQRFREHLSQLSLQLTGFS
jgi:hypothetical protein